MISFEEAKRLLQEHLGDCSDLVIETLGRSSQIRVYLKEGKIIFTNSGNYVQEIDQEKWEEVYRRREELSEKLKNRTSQYTYPAWKNFPSNLNYIIAPYIPAVMLFLEHSEYFTKDRIDYDPDNPDSRVDDEIIKEKTSIFFAAVKNKYFKQELNESVEEHISQAELIISPNFINSKPKLDLIISIIAVIIIVLLWLPFLIRDNILSFLGIKEIISYYEMISSIISGIALIVALISIRDQKIDFAQQNLRLNYSIQIEALTQVMKTKNFLYDNINRKPTDKELKELADLVELLHDSSMKMLNHLKNKKKL